LQLFFTTLNFPLHKCSENRLQVSDTEHSDDEAGEVQDEENRDIIEAEGLIKIAVQSLRVHTILSSFKVATNISVALLDCRARLMLDTAETSKMTLDCVVNGIYAVAILVLHLHWLQCVLSGLRTLKQPVAHLRTNAGDDLV
jgi:hypothetical protein